MSGKLESKKGLKDALKNVKDIEEKDLKDGKNIHDIKDKDWKDKDWKDKDKDYKDKEKLKETKDYKYKDYKDKAKDKEYKDKNKDKDYKDKDKDYKDKDKDYKDKDKDYKDKNNKDKDYKDKDYKDKAKDNKDKGEKLEKADKNKEYKDPKKDKEKEKIMKDEKIKKVGRQNGTKRAGLIFPVPKVMRELRAIIPARARVQRTSAVYLTAVMEYVMAELLEIAGNTAKQVGKKRINPRHLMLSIKNDDELNTLIRATIAGGGVVPDSRVTTQPVSAQGQKKYEVFDAGKDLEMPPSKKQKSVMQHYGASEAYPTPGFTPGGQGYGFGFVGGLNGGVGGGLGGTYAGSTMQVPQHLQGAHPMPVFQGAGKKQVLSVGMFAPNLGVSEGVNLEMKKKKVAGKMTMPNMFF